MKKLILFLTSILALSYADCQTYDNYLFSVQIDSVNTLYFDTLPGNTAVQVVAPKKRTVSGIWCGVWPDDMVSVFHKPEGRIVIPDSVVYNNISYPVIRIGNGAFRYCYDVDTVVISNNVTTIGYRAFELCSLVALNIGGNIVRMEAYAFEGCNSLNYVNFRGTSSAWSQITFYSETSNPVRYSYNLFINDSVLENVVLEDTITHIKDFVFINDTLLKTVVIPGSTHHIGEKSFYFCFNLDTVVILATVPPFLASNNVFYACGCRFLIPCGFKQTYLSHLYINTTGNWADYEDELDEIPVSIDVQLSTTNTECGSVNIIPIDGRIINCDSTCIIQADAGYGYHFDHWNNGRTNNPDTLFLTHDTALIAFFSPNQYSITTQSNDQNRGTVEGGGSYYYQDTALLIATSTEHNHFYQWTYADENGYQHFLSSNNPLHLIVDKNYEIVGHFTADTYSVIAESNDINRGRVIGGGVFDYGSPCTLTAEAYSGYQFAHWSNGATYNPYTFAVLEDTELTAVFLSEGEVGIGDIIAKDINVYSYGDCIVVEGTTEEVHVFDMVGRIVRNEALPNGVYIVKIGASPARKVVVMQ